MGIWPTNRIKVTNSRDCTHVSATYKFQQLGITDFMHQRDKKWLYNSNCQNASCSAVLTGPQIYNHMVINQSDMRTALPDKTNYCTTLKTKVFIVVASWHRNVGTNESITAWKTVTGYEAEKLPTSEGNQSKPKCCTKYPTAACIPTPHPHPKMQACPYNWIAQKLIPQGP